MTDQNRLSCAFLNPELADLEPYTPGEQPKGITNLLKLNTNENPYGPGSKVQDVIRTFKSDALRLYPDPECSLFKDAIIDELTREAASASADSTPSLTREHITVGNGSDEILAFCFRSLCNKRDGIWAPDITYSFYPVLAQLFGVPLHTIALRKDFTWEPSDYEGATGTIIIANPNAPTGIEAPLSAIETLCKQNPQRLVIIDEAYVDFGAQSALPLINRYDNVLIIRTLSKSRSLAGIRAAFAVGPTQVISVLEALRYSFNPYNLDSLALNVACAAMKDAESFEKNRTEIQTTREWTSAALHVLGFTVLPSKANFVFVQPPKAIDAKEFVARLRARGIIVRYFPDERTSAYARITIGTKPQMERFIAATKEILSAQRH